MLDRCNPTHVSKLSPVERSSVIHSDPEILGGAPVFVGTRVPLQALVDYIEGGHILEEFLDDFPSVPRELAIAAATADAWSKVAILDAPGHNYTEFV